jgi:hypothetical protein
MFSALDSREYSIAGISLVVLLMWWDNYKNIKEKK